MLDKQIELELISKARLGDKNAFAALYDTYVKKIYDFIYFKTLNKELAEDLVSQVFLKALKNISKSKNDNFSAWLFLIAKRTIIDHYRSFKDLKNIDDCWDLADGSDLISAVNNNLEFKKIKIALNKLSTSDREVIIMRFWLDLSFKEIAANLGKSEGAAKMLFFRALEKLRQNISPLMFLLISFSTICKKIN